MAVAAARPSHHMGSGPRTARGWERRAEAIPFHPHLLGEMSHCLLLLLWWEQALGTCSWGAVGPALLLLRLFGKAPYFTLKIHSREYFLLGLKK